MFSETIIEQLRSRSREMDRSRKVPEEIVEWMIEEKLFKLFVPEEWGGRMLELPEALQVFQKVSEIDGNLGWLTAIGSGGGMFAPYIQQEQAETMFMQDRAVIAGSGYPSGTAKKVEGGYLVEGEWKYCSGAPFASFFTANSVKENGEVASFIFLPDQVEIIPDWSAFGLKGTGSHTIKVSHAFVPEERTFSLMEKRHEHSGPVHTFPFIPFSQASFTAVCLGIAVHFLKEAKQIASVRLENGHARFEGVLEAVEEQEERLNKDIADFHTEVGSLWGSHLSHIALTEEQMKHFSQTCKNTVAGAIDGANSLIRQIGMEAIMETSPINKIWRDLYTAGQHAFIAPTLEIRD